MRNPWLVLIVLVGFVNGIAGMLSTTHVIAAAGEVATRDADRALDQELQWLQAELTATVEAHTSLATKAKLSADQVPGMVSVLRGKDLEARGVRTVGEALALLPGLHFSFQNITVRNIESSLSGKVKILVNELPFDSTLMAKSTPPIAMPIEMIERIEMIRGPGSAVYGEFASVGVINIITRKENKQVYARVGSNDHDTGGGMYSYADPEKNLTASINLSGYRQNGAETWHEQDVLHSALFEQPKISNAPGYEFHNEQQRSGVFTLNYKDFSLVGQNLQLKTGAGIGLVAALPPPPDRLVWGETQLGIEAKQRWKPTAALQTSFKLGWMNYAMTMDHNTLLPPGFFSQAPGNNDVVNPNFPFSFAHYHPDGVVASTYAEERRLYGAMEATLTSWQQHTILAGLEFANVKLVDVWTEANTQTVTTMEAAPWQRFDAAYIKGGVKRQVTGVMIQDQIAITNRVDLTAGLRFDHYDDVGNAMTPRIAAVYRLTDHHNLKAQYGNSFRPPSFFEMYMWNYVMTGNPNIKPETVDTYELGYIYRDPATVARVTLFHSSIQNLIGVNSNAQYANATDEIVLRGVELELEKTLTTTFKIDGNLSFIDTNKQSTNTDLPGSANWMGNAGLVYQPLPQYALSVQYRYVGEHNRSPATPTDPPDLRPKLGSTSTFNLTGSVFDLWKKGLTFRIGAMNVFDQKVVEPDPSGAYPQDLPRPGRYLWTKISYDF